MQTFHTRQQLINWLSNNAPDRIISKAVAQGEMELLGGFSPVAGSSYPGFIVYIIETLGIGVYKSTYVGIVIDNQRHSIRSFRVREPNWKDWIGWKSNNVLYQGDDYEANIEKYERTKNEQANRNKSN